MAAVVNPTSLHFLPPNGQPPKGVAADAKGTSLVFQNCLFRDGQWYDIVVQRSLKGRLFPIKDSHVLHPDALTTVQRAAHALLRAAEFTDPLRAVFVLTKKKNKEDQSFIITAANGVKALSDCSGRFTDLKLGSYGVQEVRSGNGLLLDPEDETLFLEKDLTVCDTMQKIQNAISPAMALCNADVVVGIDRSAIAPPQRFIFPAPKNPAPAAPPSPVQPTPKPPSPVSSELPGLQPSSQNRRSPEQESAPLPGVQPASLPGAQPLSARNSPLQEQERRAVISPRRITCVRAPNLGVSPDEISALKGKPFPPIEDKLKSILDQEPLGEVRYTQLRDKRNPLPASRAALRELALNPDSEDPDAVEIREWLIRLYRDVLRPFNDLLKSEYPLGVRWLINSIPFDGLDTSALVERVSKLIL